MKKPSPTLSLCIAVRSNPPEIQELLIPTIDVQTWRNQKEHSGWTTMVVFSKPMRVQELNTNV